MNLYYETNYLQHHGIKGMRWGIRRFQKKDGSLTSAGEKRYSGKTPADKKAAEDLKGQRSARRLNALKQIQQMRQDSLDRAAARKATRDKSALEKEQIRNEKEKLKLEKQQIKGKRKFDDRAQDQQATANARQYKLNKKQLDFEKEQFRSQNKPTDSDDYYELPDTPERQSSSASTGKKLAMGALAVAGTVAVGVAAKKYGPTLINKLKNLKNSKVGDAADKVKDTGPEIGKAIDGIVMPKSSKNSAGSTKTSSSNIYDVDWSDITETARSAGSSITGLLSTSTSNALGTVGNIPLLPAPKEDK